MSALRQYRQTDAERIAELEAEVAWLKSELGLQEESTAIAKLADTGLTPLEARLVLAMYRTRRTLSPEVLFDYLPHPSDGADLTIVKSAIHRIRRKWGSLSVETVAAVGYRLTTTGEAVVTAALK